MLLNADPLKENIEDKMNRLISEKKCGHMVLVLLDCFTRFGGNQYINSSATGRYEDYIIKEIVPFVDKNYNICAHAVWGIPLEAMVQSCWACGIQKYSLP